MLLLNEGGFIQLDENSDPLFRQGKCLLLSILYGRLVFQQPGCAQFTSPRAWRALSIAWCMFRVRNRCSSVTVIEGQVDMRSPSEATLRQYDEYVAPREGPAQVLRLARNEAVARAAWTKKYFRQPVAEQNRSRISPWGIAAAAAAIWILREKLRDDDSPRPQAPAGGTTGRQGPANNTPDAIPRDATGRPIIK